MHRSYNLDKRDHKHESLAEGCHRWQELEGAVRVAVNAEFRPFAQGLRRRQQQSSLVSRGPFTLHIDVVLEDWD